MNSPRVPFPSARQCAWISGAILGSLAALYLIGWAVSWEPPLPEGIRAVLMCVAVIFGTGGFITGPLVSALELGRKMHDHDREHTYR